MKEVLKRKGMVPGAKLAHEFNQTHPEYAFKEWLRYFEFSTQHELMKFLAMSPQGKKWLLFRYTSHTPQLPVYFHKDEFDKCVEQVSINMKQAMWAATPVNGNSIEYAYNSFMLDGHSRNMEYTLKKWSEYLAFPTVHDLMVFLSESPEGKDWLDIDYDASTPPLPLYRFVQQ